MEELTGRTCLVTGASGFLGSYVVEKLVQSGARVRCLVRRSSRRDFLPATGTEYVLGDVTEPSSLPRALSDVDYVFHVAGLIKAPRPEDYFRVNYLGTINLLESCRAHRDRLRRVVVISSLAAAGPSEPGAPVVETSPCRPVTPYGKSKLQAERAALAYRDQLPLTIVRPPTIYGPRDRETLLLFRTVALGLRPALPVRSEVSLIHAADLADGIVLAATHLAAVGQTYFMSGDDVMSIDALLELMAMAVGRRGLEVPVPAWALRGAARAAETLRQLGMASLVFDRWKAEEILIGCWACSNARARADLGFAPRVAVADGFADTVRWYRKMGWL
jgi:nucleoside-diphosphate-sugar epimerase